MAKRFQRTSVPKDVHQIITEQIIGLLEQGKRPWMQPWNAGDFRPKRHNGQPYHGINVLILWATAMINGYTNQHWMSYNQASQLGGNVRKGETGTMIVFYTPRVVNEGADDERTISVLRSYVVFNVEQIDNLPDSYYAKIAPNPVLDATERLPEIDAFFAATGIPVIHGGGAAFYQIAAHKIRMPAFEVFHSTEAYYGTLAHEMVHATRHPSLLDRSFGQERFGDDGYAMEELVAELGAAFLGANLGLWVQAREDHAAYLGHWLTVLRKDKKAIFMAASYAEKAVAKITEMVHGTSAVDSTDDGSVDQQMAA